jgi:hypothetical protein
MGEWDDSRFCSDDSSGGHGEVIYMREIVGNRFSPATGLATNTKENERCHAISRDESAVFFCLPFFLFRVGADNEEDDVGSHVVSRQ